jgi:hypothetical protein
MIYVVCGLIAAGKSSYCMRNCAEFFDSDEQLSKQEQLRNTLNRHAAGKDVAHITCYPTSEELEAFRTLPPEEVSWIWIDTSEAQAKKNIMERGRARDLANLRETLTRNHELMGKFYSSDIPFKLVEVFDDGERW